MTTIARLLRALAALATLLAIVAGLPAALLTWGTSPVRGEIAAESLRRVLAEPGSDRVVAGVLTIAAWCAWVLFLRALVVEIIDARRARSHQPPTAFRLGPLRMIARTLVVWITMTAGSIGGAAAGATPLESLLSPPAATAAEAPEAPAAADLAPPSAESLEEGEDLVVVETPAGVWDLAERHLGDGMRWREMWDRNRDRVQPDGRTWADPEATVLAGWTLVVPASPAPAVAPQSSPSPESSVAPPAATREITVAPGDNFWALAEEVVAETLGRTPTEAEIRDYWVRLVEANRDRLAPPGDPDLIYPGQVFEAPPATGGAAVPATASPPTEQVAEAMPAAPPPDPRQPAEPAVEQEADGGAEQQAPASNPATQVEPEAQVEQGEPSDEATPGAADGPPAQPEPAPASPPAEQSGVPAPPEAAPSADTPPSSETPTETPTVPVPTTAPAEQAPAPDASLTGDDRSAGESTAADRTGPVLGAAGTVLAVAVARALRRRRRRRAARLPVTVVTPAPPRSARPAAEEVLTADEAQVDRLDAALAKLAADLKPRGGEPCVQPQVVQVTGRRIEVLLDRADPAPPRPWRPEASGRIWVLDATDDLVVPDAASSLPALVTIGTEHADTLIDLEAFGVVSLLGDPDGCWGLARSMVTELAAKAEGAVGVDLVGGLEAHLAGLDGVRMLESWDDVDTGVIEGSQRMLAAGRWPHTFAARAAGRALYNWAPTVWVTAPCDHPRYREAVEQAAARPGTGTAIVVVAGDAAAAPAGGLRIEVDAEGTYRVPDLALTGRAQVLAPAGARMVVNLLEDADHADIAQTFDFPAAADQPTESPAGAPSPGDDAEPHDTTELPLDWSSAPAAETPAAVPGPSRAEEVIADSGGRDHYDDPEWDVLVRVCGEIHVEGGKHPLPPRESAVAAFVALHREVDTARVRDAVWGGNDVSRKTVQNVVSAVRQALGEAIYYTDQDGRLAAGDRLLTDFELVRRRLDYARRQSDLIARAETLRGALEWVTGPVCSYPTAARRSWAWIDLDNWVPTVESTVGTIAHELAILYLELGDADGVTWAASRGLAATGPREQLTVLLVRGYELAGDTPAAAAALQSYEKQMNELGGAEHSETLIELLERYLPPNRRRAAS